MLHRIKKWHREWQLRRREKLEQHLAIHDALIAQCRTENTELHQQMYLGHIGEHRYAVLVELNRASIAANTDARKIILRKLGRAP